MLQHCGGRRVMQCLRFLLPFSSCYRTKRRRNGNQEQLKILHGRAFTSQILRLSTQQTTEQAGQMLLQIHQLHQEHMRGRFPINNQRNARSE